MPITRTPIIDDDGTGTTGTVIDNAWKTEFYNQIDGVAGALVKIGSATGAAVGAGPENLTGFDVPALAPSDTIEIYLDVSVSGPAPGPIQVDLYTTLGATVLLTLSGADAGGDLNAFTYGSYRINLRMAPQYAGQVMTTAAGGVVSGTQGRGFEWGRISTTSVWGTAWALYLRQMTGLPAGTPLNWNAQCFVRYGG